MMLISESMPPLKTCLWTTRAATIGVVRAIYLFYTSRFFIFIQGLLISLGMMFAHYSDLCALVGTPRCSSADFSTTGKFL